MTAVASQLEAIDRTRNEHVAALNANDADAWVRCFTADGVQMPPNDAANLGVEAIRAWSTGILTAFRAEFSLDVQEVCSQASTGRLSAGTTRSRSHRQQEEPQSATPESTSRFTSVRPMAHG
jgi:ketosteroid isomerase-like protein